MNVFGTFLKFGEGSESVTGGGIERVINLDKNRAITLHDEWICGIVTHSVVIPCVLVCSVSAAVPQIASLVA
jgi:hypothetical protein